MTPPPGLQAALARLAGGGTLDEPTAEAAFGAILDDQAPVPQAAALLLALRARGETGPELRGALRAMRGRMRPLAAPPGAIDVCGTGGDGARTLNVSTAVAFVVAGCGTPVAKHGNRAASSAAGASDTLAALGVCPDGVWRENLALLHAPDHHPGLRHAAAARAALGVRTPFNLLGPLANPAGVARQLVGVAEPAWMERMADALAGAEHAWIVHGNGLDELSLDGENRVLELKRGARRSFSLRAEEAGLAPAPADAIRGGAPEANAAALRALLDGAPGPYRDAVLLNAAAALVVAGRTDDLREAAALAARAIDQQRARHVLTMHRAARQETSHRRTAQAGDAPHSIPPRRKPFT